MGRRRRKGTDTNAVWMGAQIKFRKEECARGMGQMPNDAAKRDAQIMFREEGCA